MCFRFDPLSSFSNRYGVRKAKTHRNMWKRIGVDMA